MSQVVTGGQGMAVASRRVGRTVCWIVVLILWLALCAELLREVWHLEAWQRLAFCTLAGMGSYYVWRLGLCAYINAGPTALTVRNRFSRWHIPYSDIADVTWLPGQGPRLALHSGPTVRLDAYTGWPAGPLGRQMMTDLTDVCRSSASGTPAVSSKRLASGIAEVLLLSLGAWFYVTAHMAS
ncbi:hypothetical protein ACH4S8_22080 [Streptomyces sp. NPDC021080]|uniref:hypothetical protein n=1 Tax=Streptomyces sp. NPDC021080 TaxID=3365110 RepID=UPI0037A2F8C7